MNEQKDLVRILCLSAAMTISAYAAGQEPALFYRGDLDNNKVTAPNGAVVNADYLKETTEGPYGKVRKIKVREGVYTITGYAYSNYTFIETNSGLIAVDTGSNTGQAREALRMIREKTQKPIIAIIYTHHHYTGGAKEFVTENSNIPVTVYGHPDLEKLLESTTGFLGPKQQRTIGRMLGFYLPRQGPDAVVSVPEHRFADPRLNESHHITVNHPVQDGENIVIDGIRAVFYHSVGDTRDSLIIHFPDLDLVVHNTALQPTLFPLSTLRGEYYRDPAHLIASIDRLRSLKPRYLIPSHGFPITSRNDAYDIATAHRDAYSFVYNQSIRAINAGLSPDQMARTIRLPPHLADNPSLAPTDVDNEYNVRAQYSGMMGWFTGDSADLHPPAESEIGQVIIEGFGGPDKVISRAKLALDQKKYNLAAKLLSHVLSVKPDNQQARTMKATALRAMAQATPSMQTRNYMLTQALDLEGAIDWNKAPSVSLFRLPSTENILAAPADTYLKILEAQVDPSKSAGLQAIVGITFNDINRSWGLHIRRGVAEVTEGKPATMDASISMSRETWADIITRKITMEQALKSGFVKNHSGDSSVIADVFNSFDFKFSL